MLFQHAIQSGNHFYSSPITHYNFYKIILDLMGYYNKSIPSAAIAYSNFYIPHSLNGDFKRNQSNFIGTMYASNVIDYSYKFYIRQLYPEDFAEVEPGSNGTFFYPETTRYTIINDLGVSWQPTIYEVEPAIYGSERFKGTFIPIRSALDLNSNFDVFNPPTLNPKEIAKYTPFNAVFYMTQKVNSPSADQDDRNNWRYEHIIFDDQLMEAIGKTLDFLERHPSKRGSDISPALLLLGFP